jgi:hypothetical protein
MINKKIIIPLIIILSLFSLTANTKILENNFPKLPNWKIKGIIEVYNPETLFEYINGAAEVFLMYDFEQLETANFENQKGPSVTIDVYQHKKIADGFGIFSQEKPLKGNYLEIGHQGYYEKGILNFFQNNFYIKLSAYSLGDQDQQILMEFARAIEKKLPAKQDLPKCLTYFPLKGKVDNSEKYISKNFLGHAFLHSAFVAHYKIDNNEFQVFIIEAENELKAKNITADYTAFVKNKNLEVNNTNGLFEMIDPYYQSQGKLYMMQKDKYVWGLFNKDHEISMSILQTIAENIPSQNLHH